MKEKPQLHLYEYKNNSFMQTAIIDDYQEISFEHNLYEAGNFTITINYNIPNALKFERGMFIQFGNNPYMFGEILSINDSIGEDGKGSQIRSITGKDARFLFKRRIIKNLNNEENWIMTDKGEICIRNLVKDQCGTNAETKRQLPIANIIPATADAVGKEYSVSESYTNLYDTLVTIATQSEIGWRIKFDGSMTLECYEGNDISNQVQFSTEFDSLSSGQFSDSSESYANSIYIGGKGIGAERDIYEGENSIEGASPSGLDRYEAWDNQSEMTSESEYEAEALSMLAQYGQTVTVSGKGLVQCPYIFQEQYDIGDVITIAFSGKSAKAQILAVTEHWTWGSYSLEFSFGKPQNDLSRQLQLILKQIQKASSKTTVTASIKWYTMTSDTVQDKSDVIYDTIGFTGAMTANKTFTFYLDDEKTGAKSYNIYAKNLSGNYTLTLTTGVSGATNFTIKGGSNIVARILVDENGNIVSQSMTATDLIESGNNQPATSNAVYLKTRYSNTQFIYPGETPCYLLIGKAELSTSEYITPVEIQTLIYRGGIQICLLGNAKVTGFYNSTSVKAHWEYMNGNRNEYLKVVKVDYDGHTYCALKMYTSSTDAMVILYIHSVSTDFTLTHISSSAISNEVDVVNSPLSQ